MPHSQETENWKENPKEFQCQECGKQCKDQQSYENHKQFHAKIEFYLSGINTGKWR